jgi:beta-lactamase regulating signal transducer with metallopeptidase domain
MNLFFDPVLFAVNLFVNLFLLGLLIASSLAVAFRLLKNISPRARYVTAVAAFLLAVIIPLVSILYGSFNRSSILNKLAGATQQSGVENSFEQNNASTHEVSSSDLAQPPEHSLTDSLNDFTLFVANSLPGSLLPVLWIVGALFFLFRDGAGHWRLRKTRQAWRPATEAERKELLCPADVPLYFDEYESPGTVGFFYPVIVLPRRFSDGLSLNSRRYIIQHEVAHARWRDPLANSFLRLIRALFWVSPALWLIERFVGIEREAAADYAVILEFSSDKAESETTALTFATTLIAVAKQFSSFEQRRFKPQATGIGGGRQLEHRIQRLLAYSSQTTRLRIALAAIVFTIGLAAMALIPLASQPIKSTVAEAAREKKIDSPHLELKALSALLDEKVIRDSEITGRHSGEVKPNSISSQSKTELSSSPNLNSVRLKANTSIQEEAGSPASTVSEKDGVSLNHQIKALNEKVQKLGARNYQTGESLQQLELERARNSKKLGTLF